MKQAEEQLLFAVALMVTLCACAEAFPTSQIRTRKNDAFAKLLDELRQMKMTEEQAEQNQGYRFSNVPASELNSGNRGFVPVVAPLTLSNTMGDNSIISGLKDIDNTGYRNDVQKRQGSWDYDYGLGGGRFGKRGWFADYSLGGGRFGRDTDHVDTLDVEN